jgi:site-specific DNA-methyltransferase (adenine-specific)
MLIHGDCIEEMAKLEAGSIDLVLTDPPYGTTECKWDSVIPFGAMWEQLNRIIKPNGAIVLFGSEPFSSALRMSNIKNYKYDWVWNKRKAGNIFLAKQQPMKIHENILIFNGTKETYNAQMIKRNKIKKSKNYGTGETMGGKKEKEEKTYTYTHKNPTSIIDISNASQKGKQHPTQKPVALMEYLIKTYTDENETVLDFTMGSGTTGVACKNLNRKFIGIEKDEAYFKIAKERIGT